MTDLKPCPFCGSDCDISFITVKVKGTSLFYTPYCTNGDCFMNMNEIGFISKDEAIKSWNRRAT